MQRGRDFSFRPDLRGRNNDFASNCIRYTLTAFVMELMTLYIMVMYRTMVRKVMTQKAI